MLNWKRVFLGLSLLEFAIGFSNARPNVFFYLGLPLGAIFFILYLICQLFEKELAFDDEQNRAMELARQAAPPTPPPASISRSKDKTNPSFNAARSP
jgi:hypothetical protein